MRPLGIDEAKKLKQSEVTKPKGLCKIEGIDDAARWSQTGMMRR